MLTLNSVLSLNLYTVLRGVFRNLLGGLKFCILSRGGGLSTPWGLPPEINRFHLSREGGGAIAHIAFPE